MKILKILSLVLLMTVISPAAILPAFAGDDIGLKRIIHRQPAAPKTEAAPRIIERTVVDRVHEPTPKPAPQNGLYLAVKGNFAGGGTHLDLLGVNMELMAGYTRVAGDQSGLIALTFPFAQSQDKYQGLYLGVNAFFGAPDSYGLPVGAYAFVVPNLKVFGEVDIVRQNSGDIFRPAIGGALYF